MYSCLHDATANPHANTTVLLLHFLTRTQQHQNSIRLYQNEEVTVGAAAVLLNV
jgi:hypothetical protein